MNHRASLLGLLAFGILNAAQPAAAKVQRVQKDPDRIANYCAENVGGAKCAPIATGDLNGDGKTDAVFLRTVASSRVVNGNAFDRRLDILFGPFAAIGDREAKADVSAVISAGSELPSIAVADFDGDGIDDLILAEAERAGATEVQRVAVLRGGPTLTGDFFMGPASRGDYRLTRDVSLPPASRAAEVGGAAAGIGVPLRSRLSPRVADVDGDGKPDLLLAVDPASLPAALQRSLLRRGMNLLAAESPSHVLVFLNAPALADRSRTGLDLAPGDEDVRIEGLGACDASSLLGTGEVTADGQTDIVVRRCPGGGVPDMLGLVPGRRDWPAGLTIDGAVTARPDVLPPGPEPTAAPGRPDPGVPGDPPRGYVAFSPVPKSLFDRPAAFFIQDVNQDGVDDLGFGFSDKTHVWMGGRDLAARVKANRSNRVYLQAGFGGTSLSGSWRVTDITGDDVPDLILTQRGGAQEATADRPVPAPIVLGGGQTDAAAPGAIAGGGSTVLTEPVKIYAGARTTRNILNLAEDEPDAIWQDPVLDLWLIGDFNGDGKDDLMMGSPGQSATSAYQVYFGPFTN